MKKLTSILLIISLVSIAPVPIAQAAVKVGGACNKAGATSTVSGVKYTCTKSSSKSVWKKTTITPAPVTPAPTVVSARCPTAAQTPNPSKTYSSVWEKYGLTKPTTVDDVIKKATDNFKCYTTVIVSPNQEIKFFAQAGVDETLITWVKEGSNFVATRFKYPKLPPTFSSIIAMDQTWLEATFITAGFPANRAKQVASNFCGGAPACGSAESNVWNYSKIKSSNSLVTDKAGNAQTPGHELFHAIQKILSGKNGGDAAGSRVPNWYTEGPAQFVGQQTSGALGFADYTTLSRPSMTRRYTNGNPINRTSNLSEIKANDKVVDPYAIGFAASEFLVAQVGVEKMVNVYGALGEGKTFDVAFKQGTGIELADFYSMFEEVRSTLGFAKS